jgi:hypothetical protein
MKIYFSTPVVILLFFIVCTSEKNIKHDIGSLPNKQFKNYTNNFNRPVPDRIGLAPEFFMKYLIEMDKIQEYKAYNLTTEEKDLFKQYFNFLPDKIKQVMNCRLIAIYFIDNFIGGGFTDYVLDNDKQMYVVLVFNPKVLSESLSDWIKYRDNSFFQNDGNIFAANELGSNYKGLLHTLVHESCHIYDYVYSMTPFTEPDLQYFGYNKKKTFFTDQYWEDYYNPEPQFDFRDRKDLKPYGFGKTISSEKQFAMYSSLSKTPFVSLYGAMTWAEDLVETFTWFYLAEKLNIYYKVHLVKEEQTGLTFEPLKNMTAIRRYDQIKKKMEEK